MSDWQDIAEWSSQGDFTDNRTIVAPATAPGPGAIAVIRLSGPTVKDILGRMFLGLGQRSPAVFPRQLIYGDILDGQGLPLDRGMAVFFPGPKSPTGEDGAEFHIHGGPGLVRFVVETAQELGARPARPGEFLQRAFLNGRLDLTQAEGVAAAMAASTAAAARSAARSLAGDLGQAIHGIREKLILVGAILEAATDFPEEDLPPQDDEMIRAKFEEARQALSQLLATSRQSVLRHRGARVVLLGPPNAGKSSLLNALVGHDRAIVSPEPGTTRDTIEVVVELAGAPVTLVDTAGLREAPGAVEKAGIERSLREWEQADLAMVLLDRGDTFLGSWLESGNQTMTPVLWVESKSDLRPEPGDHSGTLRAIDQRAGNRGDSADHPFPVSAVTGNGLPELRVAVARMLGLNGDESDPPSVNPYEGLLTHERQVHGLQLCARKLEETVGAFHSNLGPELVTIHLREALQPLDGLLGLEAGEDILSALFSRFCVGK